MTFDLKEYLRKAVNGKISPKMKAQNENTENYFRLRNEIEDKVIAETDFYTLFGKVPLSELKHQDLNPITLMMITIKALRGYADSNDIENEKCVFLHGLYLELKRKLNPIINFPEPLEDGFTDYLGTRPQREELETARFSGSMCIFCGSNKVHSNGSMWICDECKRSFRKHKA